MNNERDELATVIAEAYLNNMAAGPLAPKMTNTRLAEDILDAGWRPPAVTIKSQQGINALPDGIVICDAIGRIWQRRSSAKWTSADGMACLEPTLLPATVLHEPEHPAN